MRKNRGKMPEIIRKTPKYSSVVEMLVYFKKKKKKVSYFIRFQQRDEKCLHTKTSAINNITAP